MSNFLWQQDKASELLDWYNPFGALLFTYVKKFYNAYHGQI